MGKILNELCMWSSEENAIYQANEPEVKKCLAEFTQMEQQLLDLFLACKGMLLRYSELSCELSGYEQEARFREGFRMGASLMLELFAPEHIPWEM